MKKLFCALISLAVFLLSGCFALPVEEPLLAPPVTAVPEMRVIRTHTVTRGDVVLSSSPSTTFIPAQQEAMQFPVAGRRIHGVFVSLGDEVQAGDLLAELENPQLLDQLRDMQWEEEWAMLHLSQLIERQTFSQVHGGANSDGTPYLNERSRLEDELDLLRMRIAYLEGEIDEMQLRAPFDGVISWVMSTDGILWSRTGQPVVTVSNQDEYIFRLTGPDAQHIVIGETYLLTLSGDTFPAVAIDIAEEGLVLPAQRDANAEDVFFRIVGNEKPTIIGSAFASVFILHDRVENVIFLPSGHVNIVGDRTFVQVLEDDIIVIRDVEIGLVGNATTEIISGLQEGDLVVS